MPDSKKDTNETPASPDVTNDKPEEDQESTKKNQDIKSEDNTLTKEDIEKIEREEAKLKNGLVDRIFKKKEKPLSDETNKDENKDYSIDSDQFSQKDEIKTLKKELSATTSHLDSISISVEKLEGKLESERAVATGIEERMSRLTEEIGELRSMILDRERGFNEIETGFKKIEAMAEEMQPEMIKKNLDRKERDIIQISVQMEKADAIVSETNRQIKLFREQMDKIKSLDNLLTVSKDIEKNISKIKDTERYTGRMAAKTEELFTELDKRITQFATQSSKIDSLDELTKELMESFDKSEVKLKEAVFKEDLEKLKQSITTSNQESRDSELSNINSGISSLQDNFNKLKIQFELLDINPSTTESTKTDTTQNTPQKVTGQPSEELPSIDNIIYDKKLSELRKEIEEQNKKNVSEIANLLSITQKNEQAYKEEIENLNHKINKKTNEIANVEHGYMKDNINGLRQPPSKDPTDTNARAIRLNQNIPPENAFLNEDINTQPLYLNTTPFYDHDLRLNKLIRLIDKTEVSLKNNNIEDAKKAYNALVSAYNTVHKKVPQPQIEEIDVLIEQLNNKLKNHTT